MRLPNLIVGDLRALADAHERSLSAELRIAVREYINRNEEELEKR